MQQVDPAYEEEQPLLLAVQGYEVRHNADRRCHLENRIVIHNRAIGGINTIVGGLVGGGESSSARRNHTRSLFSGEVFSTMRPMMSQRREVHPIMFTDEDFQGILFPHDDALVVTLLVSNYNVHKILIDNGSSSNILFMNAFEKVAMDKGRILLITAPLVGFSDERVCPEGAIALPVTTLLSINPLPKCYCRETYAERVKSSSVNTARRRCVISTSCVKASPWKSQRNCSWQYCKGKVPDDTRSKEQPNLVAAEELERLCKGTPRYARN